MPGGLRDEQLAEGVAARSGDEIRIVSTRYARALGREYRERYGVRLRTDAQAVEWMQRHLMTRWGETGLVGPEALADVRRHGALLSELLARALGGQWVNVTPSRLGTGRCSFRPARAPGRSGACTASSRSVIVKRTWSATPRPRSARAQRQLTGVSPTGGTSP